MLRAFVYFLFGCVLFIGFSAVLMDTFYGGGDPFPERQPEQIAAEPKLEAIANLPYPLGNVSVAQNGRIFFTYHPEGRPPHGVHELVEGEAVPVEFEGVELETVLSIRVDNQNRLWALDYANHGTGAPKLVAKNIDSGKTVHQHYFNSDIAPLGSHLNDFQIDPNGDIIYIADASIMGLSPALIVYDVPTQQARRLLDSEDIMVGDKYVPVVQGHKMLVFGVFAIRPGVDSIGLTRDGSTLYFSPVTEEVMYKVSTRALLDTSLDEDALLEMVSIVGKKTMSDGIAVDEQDRVYITDIENSAITRLSPDGKLELLISDDQIRWPDGLSFDAEGDLYITASALHHVIARPDGYIQEQGPYQLFKLSGF